MLLVSEGISYDIYDVFANSEANLDMAPGTYVTRVEGRSLADDADATVSRDVLIRTR